MSIRLQHTEISKLWLKFEVMQEERIKEDFQLVKLPIIYEEEDRGNFECCEPELVLASNTNDSWKNDITAVWEKLYSNTDTVTFTLQKDGVETSFQPVTLSFPNDEFSKYTEVKWKDVLLNEGIGCYNIFVEYNISGVEGSYNWGGKYNLLPYSVENAMGTGRLRAVFDHYHELQNLNFKGARVNSTIRFNGYIGNEQSNKEIKILNQGNRVIQEVVKEDLPTWEMKTDPLKIRFTRQLRKLFLLHQTELYASDHNWFNHDYNILDIPVTILETDEMEYKEFNRGASVSTKLVDRTRNKRNFYA